MNIEVWQFVLTVVSTVAAGSWISATVALRYAKRNALANTEKNEAEAEQEKHKASQEKANAESAIIANAKEIIQLYQDGMQKLTELHEKQSKELEDRCLRIEEQWKSDKELMQKQIDALKVDNKQLRVQLGEALANSSNSELIQENAKLKLENKELKSEVSKLRTEVRSYKTRKK